MREKQGVDFRKSIKAIVATTAGAGLGVLGAVAGVTAAAVMLEVALPVTLCVWAGGIACGALGLSIGVGENKKEGKKSSGTPESSTHMPEQVRARVRPEARAVFDTENRQKVVVLPGDTKEERRC